MNRPNKSPVFIHMLHHLKLRSCIFSEIFPTGQQETLKKEVEEFFDQYFKALRSRNLKRIGQFWLKNAVRMPPDVLPVKGKEGIFLLIA